MEGSYIYIYIYIYIGYIYTISCIDTHSYKIEIWDYWFWSILECLNSIQIETSDSPCELLLRAALLIPISHYLLGFIFTSLVFLYNFLEIHILQDLLSGCRGDWVSLTFNSWSEVYHFQVPISLREMREFI